MPDHDVMVNLENSSIEELLAENARLRDIAEEAKAKAIDASRARDSARAALDEERCYGTALRLPPLPPWHLDGRNYIDGTQYPSLSLIETISPSAHGSVMHIAIEGDALSATSTIRAAGGRVDLIIVQPDRVPKEDPTSFLAGVSADLQSAKETLSPTGSLFLFVESGLIDRYIEIGNHIFGAENAHHLMGWKKNTNPTNIKGQVGKLMNSFYCIIGWHGSDGYVRPALDASEGEAFDLEDDGGKYRLATEQQVARGDFGWSRSAVFDILGVSPKEGHSWKRPQPSVQQDIDSGIIEVHEGVVTRKVYEGKSVRGFSGDITEQAMDEYGAIEMLDGKEFPSMATASKALTRRVGKHSLRGILPVGVVKFLVRKFAPRGDETILDFYAGSGTLLEAVAVQNSQDGGRRRAIVVEQRTPTKAGEKVGSMMDTIIVPRARIVLPKDQGLYVLSSSSISSSRIDIAKKMSVVDGNVERVLSAQPALVAIAILRESIAPTSVEPMSGNTTMIDHDSQKIVLVWGNANSVEFSIIGNYMVAEAKKLSEQFPEYDRAVYFADRGSASSETPSADAIQVSEMIPGWRVELPGMEYMKSLEAHRSELIASRRTSSVAEFAALSNRIRFGK